MIHESTLTSFIIFQGFVLATKPLSENGLNKLLITASSTVIVGLLSGIINPGFPVVWRLYLARCYLQEVGVITHIYYLVLDFAWLHS